jgi:hypothetical protein
LKEKLSATNFQDAVRMSPAVTCRNQGTQRGIVQGPYAPKHEISEKPARKIARILKGMEPASIRPLDSSLIKQEGNKSVADFDLEVRPSLPYTGAIQKIGVLT